MADLSELRAAAEALRDELHAHDVARDLIAARKRAVDADLFAAASTAAPAEGDAFISAPMALLRSGDLSL